MKKNVLVIGSGTAAYRFIELLKKEHQPILYKHRTSLDTPVEVKSVTNLDSLNGIDGAIVASPNLTHSEYTQTLLRHNIPVLVEKPIATTYENAQKILSSARSQRIFLMCGLNLRYLPIIRVISDYLKRRRLGGILAADIYAGSFLPNWRPYKNYQDTYSAHYDQGGGVALDLIHEIDLSIGWFGPWRPTRIVSRRLSKLAIDCEDYITLETDKPFRIKVTLDYLNYIPTRRYTVIGTKGSLLCDIYRNIFQFNSSTNEQKTITDPHYFDISHTYKEELDSFLDNLHYNNSALMNERFLGIDALEIALTARRYVSK